MLRRSWSDSGSANAASPQGLRHITATPSDDLADVREQERPYRELAGPPTSTCAPGTSPTRGARRSSGAKTPDAPPASPRTSLRPAAPGRHAASPASREEIDAAGASSTGSSTGTWSSRRSSGCRLTAAGVRPGHRLGGRLRLRARQPAVGAGQAPGAGVLRRRATQTIAKAANKAARERLIKRSGRQRGAADAPCTPSSSRAPRGRGRSAICCATPAATRSTGRGDVNTYAVFAETASHGHRSARPARPASCPPASPRTRRPRRSSPTWSRTRRLASFLDFENEAFILSRAVHHSVRFCPADRRRPRRAGGPGVLRVRYAGTSRTSTSRRVHHAARGDRSWSTPTPAPARLPLAPRRRDHPRHLPPRAGPDQGGRPGRQPVGPVVHDACSTWPTTRTCSATREQLEADGWTLRGNIFARATDGGCCRCTRRRCSTTTTTGWARTRARRKRRPTWGRSRGVTPEQHDDPDFVPMPRYWVPEFDVRRKARQEGKCHLRPWRRVPSCHTGLDI